MAATMRDKEPLISENHPLFGLMPEDAKRIRESEEFNPKLHQDISPLHDALDHFTQKANS